MSPAIMKRLHSTINDDSEFVKSSGLFKGYRGRFCSRISYCMHGEKTMGKVGEMIMWVSQTPYQIAHNFDLKSLNMKKNENDFPQRECINFVIQFQLQLILAIMLENANGQ